MNFCNKLQMLRKRTGLTQDEFSAKIGVSRQAISKWESGNAYPDLKNLQTLCSFFAVTADALLNPKNESLTPSNEACRFDASSLANNIKRIRLARGIAQEAFAEQMNVSRQSVSKWENGTTVPKTELLILMLDILETDFFELLPTAKQPLPADAPQEEPPVASEPLQAEEVEQTEEPTVTDIPEPLPESPTAPTEQPPKKKKYKPLLFLIPSALLLVAALTVGLILFVPFLTNDPLNDAVTEFFYDPAPTAAMMERWKKEGISVTLGKGKDTLKLTLQANDTAIAIGGLNGCDGQALLLPRTDIDKAMESSPLKPHSGSLFALTSDEYEQLRSILKLFETKENREEDAALRQSLKNIVRICEDAITTTEGYTFAQDRFALSKNVSYLLDKTTALALIDGIKTEVKQNQHLNELYGANGLLSASENGTAQAYTLEQLLTDLRKDLNSSVSSMSITLSYSVVAGKLDTVSYTQSTVDSDKSGSHSNLVLQCVYEQNQVGFDIQAETSSTFEDLRSTTFTTYTYRKKADDSVTEMSLSVESCTETADSSTTVKIAPTKETYTLRHDRNTHGFTLQYNAPALSSTAKVTGSWETDASTGRLAFALNLVQVDKEKLIDTDVLTCSIQALGGAAFPEGKQLLSMSEAELQDLIKYFPAKKLSVLAEALTGEPLDLIYSQEGLLVPSAAQYNSDMYEQRFYKYVRENGETLEQLPIKRFYVYNSGYDVYALFRYNGDQITKTEYAYTLTDDILQNYHEAVPENGSLTVHRMQLTQTLDPTCTQQGFNLYKCDHCQKEYKTVIECSEHPYQTQYITATTDDGVSREAKREVCTACGSVFFQIFLPNYATLCLEEKSDGTYAIGDYNANGYNLLFSFPEKVLEGIEISEMWIEENLSYYLIRIPNGIRKIPQNTFTYNANTQVLILPSTLTEIASGAFADTPKLHTVFYCGTEEQWKQVKLNEYESKWADVEVIFTPDGVSAETAYNSYFSYDRIDSATDQAKSKTESITAAEALAQIEGVTLVDRGVVANVLCDNVSQTAVVIGAYENGKQPVRVYSNDTFSLLTEFETDFEIVRADAWEGYVALAGSSDLVSVYQQSNGALLTSFAPFQSAVSTVKRLTVIDGTVYYTNGSTLFAYSLEEQATTPLLTLTDMVFLFNRDAHRLIAYGEEEHYPHVCFIDTAEASVLKKLPFSIYYNLKVEIPNVQSFSYVTVSSNSKTVYDLDGNRLMQPPETTEDLKIEVDKQTWLQNVVLQNDQTNVSLYIDLNYDLFLLLQNRANSEPTKLPYYAETALVLPNGNILLYTKGGYGLIAVSMSTTDS